MQEHVEQTAPAETGGTLEVRDEEGNVLGRHEGIANFTIGQRRGVGTMLYDRLLAVARKAGISVLRSDIHFENRGIRELLERAGPAKVIDREGIVLTLELRI